MNERQKEEEEKREETTLTLLVEQSYSVSRNSCGPLMSLERRSSPFYLAIIIVFATYCIVADRKIKHRRPTTNYYYYILNTDLPAALNKDLAV